MTLQLKMMNKYGIVTTKLARELLTMSVGDRIGTVSGYAEKFESSRGTVQGVIKLLEEEKCICLVKRGHLGTFITFIDYEKLWQFTNWGVLTGASALPYTKKQEGIATAIYHQMNQKSIPFNFAYMQGSTNRVRGLLDQRYDFVVISKGSALGFLNTYPELEMAIELKKYSYLGGYALIFSRNCFTEIADGMRIGLDKNSPDQMILTEKLCKNKKVEYVNVSYSQMVPSLVTGKIDAAVYNMDIISKPEIKSYISYKPINMGDYWDEEQTKAVILVNRQSFGIANLLKQIIDVNEVEKIQEEVVSEVIAPTY